MKICTACGNEYGDEVLFCNRDGTPLRPSGGQTADLVGQVIADRYHIQKKLGEGGMGQVYLAEHVKMGRRCAIKIMSPAMMKDPDAISRFNREAANASRIGHPNVCAIYDFGETPEGLIYLAMEFIEGRSLNAILDEVGTLPVPRAAGIITQCADALQVAHDLGIVHRDLKPDNIMVVSARGQDTVKVVDFGIAKAVGAEGGAQKVTKTGFVVGTPEYMSPEQLAGDPVDGRSDLYSLALVFYRMLTGGTPFPADSQQETMIKRLTDDPLPLASARPDIRFPPELQRVLDRALARLPQDRYSGAAEFARDVRTLSGAAPGAADMDVGTQQLRRRPGGEAPSAMGEGVPATRVDPAVERQRAKAAAAPKATPSPVATRSEKKLPVVPLAIGVMVLALAGGGYLLKDRILGTAKADSARADTSKVVLGGGQATPTVPDGAVPQDTAGKTKADTLVQLSHQTSSTAVNPAGTPAGGEAPKPPLRDSAHGPIGTIEDRPAASLLPTTEEVTSEDPKIRAAARQRAIRAYYRQGLSDSLRASAALRVMGTYTEDGDLRSALNWADSSYRLRPDSMVLRQINVLKQALGN